MNIDPEGFNIILAQSHFIKTVEDVYEALVTSFPGIKFGIAFNESSGERLVRFDGTDASCIEKAKQVCLSCSSGHLLAVVLKDAYPINVLDRIKSVQEVAGIYCSTANPLQVIIAETEQGRGVLGVIDGYAPLGVEDEEHVKKRKSFLRSIGYKR